MLIAYRARLGTIDGTHIDIIRYVCSQPRDANGAVRLSLYPWENFVLEGGNALSDRQKSDVHKLGVPAALLSIDGIPVKWV